MALTDHYPVVQYQRYCRKGIGTMEALGVYVQIYWMHFAIAFALAAPIVLLGRHRVHWCEWELLAFVLPFVVWMILSMSPLEAGRKSLANLGEPFTFSPAIPVAALVRVAFGKQWSERVISLCLLVGLCALAAAVFFLTPPWPEV